MMTQFASHSKQVKSVDVQKSSSGKHLQIRSKSTEIHFLPIHNAYLKTTQG